MIRHYSNISLKPYNTFNIDVKARELFILENKKDIISFLEKDHTKPLLILGEGSNILFTKNFLGTIVKPAIKGIEVVKEDSEYVYVKASSGEVWDDFVEYCVNNNWGGLENLSLIPGNVGSSPVQNIGAYSVEVKDVIESVHTINIETIQERTFTNTECNFDYRNSIFKNEFKGKYIIYEVVYKLSKKPNIETSYGRIEEELQKFSEINLKTIRQAIINIRRSKLPEPDEIGNAGSFFNNPIVLNKIVEKLKQKFESMPVYPVNETHSKLAAGWLIDQCNLKGYRINDAGVHENQALVLVNYGNATGNDILELSKYIQKKVKEKFKIVIEPEVNLV